MFDISQKIEEIRQKPEHIRMRYVWVWMAISMIFVFGIWIFSAKENIESINFKKKNFSDLRSEVSNVGENNPSLDDRMTTQKESISSLEN